MILHRLVSTLSRPLTLLVFRPTVSGAHYLPRRGFVLAANHLSGFDAFALSYGSGGRRLRSMGKNELFERSVLGPVVRGLGAFPAQEVDGVGGLATATALARRGEVVLIFPTGARLRLDKDHRPHSGAARTALGAGVPLVPAALRGTDGWRQRTRPCCRRPRCCARGNLQAMGSNRRARTDAGTDAGAEELAGR